MAVDRRQDNSLTSDRVWSLADAIPGVPDTDYPIFSEIPDTDFSCDGRPEGEIYEIQLSCCVSVFLCVVVWTSGLRFHE